MQLYLGCLQCVDEIEIMYPLYMINLWKHTQILSVNYLHNVYTFFKQCVHRIECGRWVEGMNNMRRREQQSIHNVCALCTDCWIIPVPSGECLVDDVVVVGEGIDVVVVVACCCCCCCCHGAAPQYC